MMKRLALLLLILSFCLTACEKDEDPILITTDQTVLMYLPWATNLLPAATP